MSSPAADDVAHLTAALADRYRIERELGAGGMATVYLAHDIRHDRRVAIKVLRAELAAVVGAQRFLAEIRTTANLQHPHILPLFDSGELEGTVFYVMPYVEGESLRERLAREKQLPLGDALRVAGEVAGALDYAHRHGVIHRDIKPENILLHDGQALVADFGIALAVANTSDGRLTETGMSLGTPKYMSPEQAMGERAIDARTDVYALGCVVYEMLTGEPPFTGATAQAIVGKVLTDIPRPPSDVRRSVPSHVDDAVLTALEKLPADRFASAAELSAALGGSSRPRTRRQPAIRRRQFDRTASLATALGVTTLLALGWGIRQRYSRPARQSAPVMRLQFPVDLARMSTGGVLAISPDGSKIVTIEFLSGGLETHLVVHPLDQTAPTAIAGSEGGLSPFFSPDGGWVAWAAGSRLMRARIDGGPGSGTASLVTDLGATDFVDSGAWTDDGTIVFTSRGARLFRVSAEGGTATRIASSIALGGFNLPVALPGGKRIIISTSSAVQNYEMAVLSVDRGEQLATLGKGLALQYVDSGDLVYVTPDGAVMAVPFDAKSLRSTGTPVALPVVRQAFYARSRMTAVSSGGTVVYAGGLFGDGQLVRVTPGGAMTVLPPGAGAIRGPRFSPDGRRVAFDIESGGDLIGDVFVYDQASSVLTRLTSDNASVFPEWTPDGASILYSTVANGKRGIDRMPADGSTTIPTRVVEGAVPVFEAVVAGPSGRLILRRNADSTGRDIVFTSLDGKAPVAPIAAGRFQERSPAISPDGRYLAYVSDESGRDEVYAQPVQGTGRVGVSANGGTEPRWAPSGKEIYYWSRDTLFAAPVATAPALSVGSRRFVLTGHYAREPFHANYDVAPDGRSFVVVRPVESRDARGVFLVLNWFDSRSRDKGR